MIQEFKRDLKIRMDASVGPGMDLESIQNIQLGDSWPGREMPAITVDSDEQITVKRTAGKVELSVDFLVVLYVAMLTGGHEEANAAANDLVIRRVGNTYKGLHPFLSRFNTWNDGGGTTWKITLADDVMSGNVKSDVGKFASVAKAFRLTASTWLNPTQY